MNQESRLSLSLGHKVLLLNDLEETKSFLVIRESGVGVFQEFKTFLKEGRANDEFCFFAYDNSDGRFHPEQAFEGDEGVRLLSLTRGTSREIEDLNKAFREAHRKASGEFPAMRVVMDFGGLTSRRHEEEVLDTVRRVHERRKKDLTIRSIASFQADSLTESAMEELVRMHESVIFSGQDESKLSFHGGQKGEIDLSSVDTVPKPDLEHFVKNHLRTLVLALLLREPMCGYDVIKTIHRNYGTFLSQGTVYPLLYSLRDDGLLEVDEPSGSRAKVYTLTEEGKNTAEDEIRGFKKAQKYLLESIERE